MAENGQKKEDNVVFIGTKPFMNYVSSVNLQFSLKKQKEVTIKARGKFINRAVDVAQVVKNRSEGIEIKDIKIDTESFQDKEGKTIKVSTIEINLQTK